MSLTDVIFIVIIFALGFFHGYWYRDWQEKQAHLPTFRQRRRIALSRKARRQSQYFN